jgi:hypothetical protein
MTVSLTIQGLSASHGGNLVRLVLDQARTAPNVVYEPGLKGCLPLLRASAAGSRQIRVAGLALNRPAHKVGSWG